MPIAFKPVGAVTGVIDGPAVLNNPTSLQFGPDGRLYVSEQNGDVNAFTIAIQDGQYVAAAHELLSLPGGGGVVKSLQNHNDDGSLASNANRQVTGLVVAGTTENPVLYISSSDPRISTNKDAGLDTNSGVITRVTWTGAEWDAVDIVRGLPRSEENHSNNGLAIHPLDPTKLFVMVGGNTNNGAPSSFFSYTGEYALSGTLLEIDLADIESRPILTDPTGGQNGQPRKFVYDLPTLDDPNVENVTDGVGEDANGMDENGPWGGNDGLNMAILPADAPLRVYADGFRNAYDIAFTKDGRLYTVDNGSNGGLGANPATETGDTDGDGIPNEALNTPNNGGVGDPEPLFLIEEGGSYGHAAPVRANQNQSWTAWGDTGAPDASVAQNTVADISARTPVGVAVAPGFLIDPSRFAAAPGQTLADLSGAEAAARLLESGVRVKRDGPDSKAIVNVGSSTNGIMVYDSGGQAFNGVLDGKLFVTQFNDNVTLLNLNAAGTGLAPVPNEGPDGVLGTADDGVEDADGVFFVANNSLGVPLGNPLDITQGPNGTLWVAEIGTNKITVLAPSDIVLPGDTDSDNDGIENALDPFLRDASNGTGVVVAPGAATVWEFSQGADASTPGPDGFGGGLTGHMIDGTTDFEAFLQSPSPRPGQNIQLDNVKFVTAAGGGTTVVEEVSNGDAFGGLNSGRFLFHTGFTLAESVETFTVTWVVKNPGALVGGSDMSDSYQQIGGYIGDGTQSNFLKIVAMVTNDAGTTALIQIQLENGDAVAQVINIGANDIFNNAVLAPESDIVFSLTIDPAAATAVPKAVYFTNAGPVEVMTSQTINLAGSAVLDTILGNGSVAGQPTGIAAGLFSTSISSAGDTFQAVFDSITVTATEKPVAPEAGDDAARTAVGQVLTIPVAQLLANDTDANAGDTLSVVSVGNAVNGTAALAGGVVIFTPTPGFEGAASFDYTVSDGALTDTATVAVTVVDTVVLYRVNAGGPEVAATDGGLAWSADDNPDSPFLASKGSDSTSGFNVLPGTGLPKRVPAAIFLTERWDSPAAPAMEWAFAVDPGLYEVSLFMGNGWSGTSTSGTRVFDVAIEGAVPAALNDIDLIQRFGHLTGGVITTDVEVTDGTLDIAFLHGVQNPLVNGIQIARIGSPVTRPVVEIVTVTQAVDEGGTAFISIAASAPVPNGQTVDVNFTISPTGGASPGAGGDYAYSSSTATFGGGAYTDTNSIAGGSADLQIPVSVLTDAGIDPGEGFTLTINSVSPNAVLGPNATATVTIDDTSPAPGTVLYRVNAGGPTIAATDGRPDWGADNNPDSPFLASKGSDTTNGFNVLPGTSLPEGVPAAIFQTERFDRPDAPAMEWAFAVDPGRYEVSLFMGNGWSGTATPGARVFDVAIEGVVPAALDDIDLVQRFGHLTGGVITTEVEVTDGTLDIAFLHGAQNPLINGIQIARAGAPDLVGAATLTINNGSNNIEISNFGNTSFVITNTGEKAISFIELDVTDALLPDAVFDPFGLAGDTAAKILTLAGGSDGGTGLVAPPGGFGTGAIGVTYIGAGGTAGFEKIRLDFTDFDPGETISFGVDMDPNSIAGAVKSTLDSGAPLAGAGVWDVGGIGGAELSGGLFTVGYADGAVSEGKLMGQGTGAQMGASALATDRGEGLAVDLTVAGLLPGAEGTYGPGGPQILISGPEGAVARVLVAKGFIVPFTNPFDGAYAEPFDAQLRALEDSGFPANNLVEMQYRDVTLTGAAQDISALFDFSQVAAFDLSVPDQTNDYGVLAEDKLALGVVASIVDPGTDLPRGPVTSPIHLTYAEPEADLSLAYAVSDTTPEFGQSVSFTLTLANAGPVDAADVDVRALLPNGFAFETASGPGGYDAASGLWNVGEIAAGAEVVLTLAATVLAPEAAPDVILHRINVGGPALDAPDGSQGWTADTAAGPSAFRVGGSTLTYTGDASNAHGGPIVTDDASVPAYAPAALYNTERYDKLGGENMVWSFPLEAGAEVEVRLHFAELYAPVDLAGERVFDVALEGVVPAAFDDIDHIADAGAKGAYMRSAVTTVSVDGTLDIEFLHVAQNPALKGIEIVVPGAPGAPLDHVAKAEIVASSLSDPDSTPGNADPLEDDQASVTVMPGVDAGAASSSTAEDTFRFTEPAAAPATADADVDAAPTPFAPAAGVEGDDAPGAADQSAQEAPQLDWADDWPTI